MRWPVQRRALYTLFVHRDVLLANGSEVVRHGRVGPLIDVSLDCGMHPKWFTLPPWKRSQPPQQGLSAVAVIAAANEADQRLMLGL